MLTYQIWVFALLLALFSAVFHGQERVACAR